MSVLLTLLLYVAVVQIFPPLTDIGDNMLNNFLSWGNRRILEIPQDEKIAPENRAVEIGKLNDRLGKFKDKMSFLAKFKSNIQEARKQKAAVLLSAGGSSMQSMEISR